MQEYFDFFHAHPTLCFAWIAALGAIIYFTVKERTRRYGIISVAEATHFVNRENGVFVDLRAPEEFKHAHINNSLSLLPSQLSDKHHPHLDGHKADPVILVCKTGQTALSKADALVDAGFERVFVLKDGLVAWNEQNLPLVGKKKLTKEERKQHRKGHSKTLEQDEEIENEQTPTVNLMKEEAENELESTHTNVDLVKEVTETTENQTK